MGEAKAALGPRKAGWLHLNHKKVSAQAEGAATIHPHLHDKSDCPNDSPRLCCDLAACTNTASGIVPQHRSFPGSKATPVTKPHCKALSSCQHLLPVRCCPGLPPPFLRLKRRDHGLTQNTLMVEESWLVPKRPAELALVE